MTEKEVNESLNFSVLPMTETAENVADGFTGLLPPTTTPPFSKRNILEVEELQVYVNT
ncbi:hypothetical protein BgiBS90_013805, partial [Biomphalaria glabrata]